MQRFKVHSGSRFKVLTGSVSYLPVIVIMNPVKLCTHNVPIRGDMPRWPIKLLRTRKVLRIDCV